MEPTNTPSSPTDTPSPTPLPSPPSKMLSPGRLILLALVIIMILVGLYGWKHRANKKPAQNATSKTSTPSANPKSSDLYAGWKTYKSPAEKFSFKYPGGDEDSLNKAHGWNLSTNKVSGNLKELITLSGPHGFTLTYSLEKSDSALQTPANHAKKDFGDFTYDPTSNAYKGAESLAIHGLDKKVYLLVDDTKYSATQTVQGLGVGEDQNYTDQKYILSPYYEAKNATGYLVVWYGSYRNAKGMPVPTSYDKFIAKPEVATAKLILQSISY